MISFYSCSVGNDSYTDYLFDNCVKDTNFIMHESTKMKGSYSLIQKDDILLLKYRGKFVAYGKVVKVFISNDKEWNLRVEVQEWIFYNGNNKKDGIPTYGLSGKNVQGGQYDTVKKLNSNFAYGKIKSINSNNELFNSLTSELNKLNNQEKIEERIKRLEQKHQIIFTGAPGTGKTYLAREITESIVENQDIQTSFVQFHPSYDYADFVEGLRPIMKGDNQLGFELKNGTFKEFCRKAGVIERLKLAGKDITDENIKLFLNVDEKHELFEFWKDYTDELEKGQNDEKDKEPPLPKFVFMIDEINRAEISKVFGELFFAIDVGYRGEKGKIKTQYANMQNDNTFFVDKEDDYFFVPSNVYIIGTMNDIDRSVEMFDFAMRRRFAWEEIKVQTTLDNILSELKDENLEKTAKAKINALNAEIKKIEGLNSSYHVGGAYFLKLKEDNSFDNLWTYHLETLLKEYLRGLHDAEGKLDELRKAYNNAK